MAAAGLGLALAAGCVAAHGHVVFFPPPILPPPPPVIFHPPPPPVVVAPPPVFIPPPPPSLVQKAEAGDPVAQFTLGSCYANGRGVPRNYAVAVQWYYRSAVQGYAPAQNRLGLCYYRGWGTPQNFSAAVTWYRKAAAQGYAPAEDNLGVCYFNGHGVPRDYHEAERWYSMAAAQGNQLAATHLRHVQVVLNEAPAPVASTPTAPAPQAAPDSPPQNQAPAESNEASGGQMSVDEIKELSSAGVKADAINDQIKSTNSKFTSQDLAAAQQANLDPAVIACMKENMQ